MSNVTDLTYRQKLFLAGITVTAVLFGYAVRLNGLGAWPLSVDEYYLARSVTSILDNGLPNFACGGFYVRGLLQQYVSAAAMAVMDNAELAMRIYPILFSIIVLWFAYKLGERIGGMLVGCLVLILMSISLWEIEFSRFARMYMPFQALALIQIYLLVRVVFDGVHGNFVWMIIVCILATFTYEGAIFLTVPLFIAMLRVKALRSPLRIISVGCVVSFIVWFLMFPFRTYGVKRPTLPDEVVKVLSKHYGSTLVDYPDLSHLSLLQAHSGWLLALVTIVLAAAFLTYRHIRNLKRVLIPFWAISLASFSLSLIGFGILVYICATLVLLDREERAASKRFIYPVVVPTVMIMLAYWGAFFWVNLDLEPRSIASALLKYPNVTGPVIYHFMKVVPVLIYVLFTPVIIYTIVLGLRRDRHDDYFVLLGGIAIIFYAGVVLVSPQPIETRYIFFIYPIILCLFCMSMVGLSAIVSRSRNTPIMLTLAIIAVFALTEEFDLDHYFNINTARINYRINFPPLLQEHFKSRRDSRSPSEYINDRLREHDVVIIAESEPEFYLDRVDYRYKNMERSNFPGHIGCGIEHDTWSNAPVLYKTRLIDDVIHSASGYVWIIETIYPLDEWQQRWRQFEVFVAADGRTHVLRIPPGTTG